MVDRKTYNRDLNAAVDAALQGRTEIWLNHLRDHLIWAHHFEHETPSSTTLAKLLVNRGWTKFLSNMPGTLYRAPEAEAA